MPAPPTVSVLTTSYNREAYIAATIESVLAQTFTDFEYIIVDDCSTDRSFEIAASYAAKDPRIRAFRNTANLGDYPNRNRAASYATGTYLKFIDSDDVLYPHAIQVMIACMQNYPDAALGLCAKPVENCPFPLHVGVGEAFDFHFDSTDLFGRAPGSAIVRREEFIAIGGFSGVRQIGDFELWIRMALQFAIVAMPRELSWARTHAAQEQAFDNAGTKHQMKLKALQSLLTATTEGTRREWLSGFIARFEQQHRRQQLRSLVMRCVRWPARFARSLRSGN